MKTETSIDLPESKACAFYAYLRGDLPFMILSRNLNTATFVTREQRGHPHVLVLPVRHVETILELTDAEAAAVAIA